MTATETCPVEDCPAGFRHWHSKTGSHGHPRHAGELRRASNAWFRAREEIAIENVTPAHRSPEKNLYLVPADRLDDLIYPEPPKDLAERLMVRLRGAEHDLVVSELRAALAAEGVEG